MKSPQTSSPVVISRRQLRNAKTERPLEIVLYAPIQDADIWVCRVELVRDGTPSTVVDARGVDSFQSLIVAVAATRNALKEVARDLIWLGEPGELGLPLVVQDDDPDFIGLVENILETEYRRQIIVRKALHRDRTTK